MPQYLPQTASFFNHSKNKSDTVTKSQQHTHAGACALHLLQTQHASLEVDFLTGSVSDSTVLAQEQVRT